MKKLLCLALLPLVLAGCAAPAATAEATPATAAETPTSTAAPGPALHTIDSANSRGSYKRTYDKNGDPIAVCMDFSAAELTQVGEPVTGAGNALLLFADEDALYWACSATVNDTPVLLKSDLDGSNRAPLYELPQGTAVLGDLMAGDGQDLYFSYCEISPEPTQADKTWLVRLDPEAQTLEKLTAWNDFGGQLLGTWGDKLVLTRLRLDENCPDEPVIAGYHVDNLQELTDWLYTDVCAFDPNTGTETVLYTEKGRGCTRVLGHDALWGTANGQLLRRPLGSDADEIVATLPRGASGYPYVFDEDVLLQGQSLYIYELATGELTESPLKRADKDGEPTGPMPICQTAPGEYLILENTSPIIRTQSGTDGMPYSFNGTRLFYSIATREALQDESVPTRPITLPDWYVG